MSEITTPERRSRGWPKGKPRGPRATWAPKAVNVLTKPEIAARHRVLDAIRLLGSMCYGSAWQVSLADDLEVAQRTLRYWLSETHPPPEDTLDKLRELYKRHQVEHARRDRELRALLKLDESSATK